MTEPRTYPAGVPCWIDIEPPDADVACAFYGGLFGWTFENAMPPGAPGHYFIARLDGRDVGAIGMPGDGVAWNTYIAVDDADATCAALAAIGATVVAEPWDAGPGGRAAVLRDPGGATFRLWQARRRLGAQAVNEPGTWNFSDLHSADPPTAEKFYGGVFGWEADHLDGGPVMWRRPGYGEHLAATSDPQIHDRQAAVSAPPGFADAIAWLAPLQPGEEPHWHVTFAVADRAPAWVAVALALGAADASGPVDTPWTKLAVVRDPQGAVFTLSEFIPPG